MQIGIVGLPNVGKSTLFNALLETARAQAGNFPFTTVEPNVGVVAVPDERLDKLAALVKPEKITPATVRFVDIAGLVRGAHKGEGLGNQFLSHIREVDAIAMVVRFFDDPKVVHVAGKIDPADDIRTIQLELILADLATVTKRIESLEGKAKTGDKTAAAQIVFYSKLKDLLENERLANDIGPLNEHERHFARELSLLTMKPFLYVANVGEEQLRKPEITSEVLVPKFTSEVKFVPISAKVEAELAELSPEDQAAYLRELGLSEPGRNKLIRAAYETLGLITYFTAGPKEVRAWTIRRGTKAPQAAGAIHGDFERGFIAAEVVPWDKLIEAGDPSTVSLGQSNWWNEAKNRGWIRTEGKDYLVADGDVILFRFNV